MKLQRIRTALTGFPLRRPLRRRGDDSRARPPPQHPEPLTGHWSAYHTGTPCLRGPLTAFRSASNPPASPNPPPAEFRTHQGQ